MKSEGLNPTCNKCGAELRTMGYGFDDDMTLYMCPKCGERCSTQNEKERSLTIEGLKNEKKRKGFIQ